MTQHVSTKADPREPLHPQVKVLFDMFLALRPAERTFDPMQMRVQTSAMIPFLNAEARAVAREEELRIPGPAGNIRALLFAPENTAGEALPVLVISTAVVGVILSPESHVKLTKQFAVGAGLIVVSVDYRLAPENPAPFDDCVAPSAGSAKTPPHSAATRRGCRSAGIRLAAAWPPRLPSGCSPGWEASQLCAHDLPLDGTRYANGFYPDSLTGRSNPWKRPSWNLAAPLTRRTLGSGAIRFSAHLSATFRLCLLPASSSVASTLSSMTGSPSLRSSDVPDVRLLSSVTTACPTSSYCFRASMKASVPSRRSANSCAPVPDNQSNSLTATGRPSTYERKAAIASTSAARPSFPVTSVSLSFRTHWTNALSSATYASK